MTGPTRIPLLPAKRGSAIGAEGRGAGSHRTEALAVNMSQHGKQSDSSRMSEANLIGRKVRDKHPTAEPKQQQPGLEEAAEEKKELL